jgi:hypothetical protein
MENIEEIVIEKVLKKIKLKVEKSLYEINEKERLTESKKRALVLLLNRFSRRISSPSDL